MSDYFAYSGPMVTTAPYPTVALAAATTKTILQIKAGPADPLIVWKWGVDFDGTGTAPIKCELIHTGVVAATVTAHVAAGVQPYGVVQDAAAVVLGTAATGYNATAEGTITATRYGSLNSVLPGNGDRNEWSLGREFYVPANGILRIRCTAPAAVNAVGYICWSE
jgi:uncharacterized protein YaiE (UPF0345 family)